MDESLPEPVEGFFQRDWRGSNDAFRQKLLERTSRMVRRRRWRKRFLGAAALAACFLGGAVCVYWLEPQADQLTTAPQTPPKVQPPAPAPDQPPEVPAQVIAVAAEWKAFDNRDQKGELYREAGDLYVEENRDYESALRCYTQALDAASAQDLAISPDDNWLLMALKDARQREKNDAKTQN